VSERGIDALAALREAASAPRPRAVRARHVAAAIRAHGEYRWVGLYDVDEAEVGIVAWSGGGPPTYPRFPRKSGLAGRAIERAATVVVNDVSGDPAYLEAFGDTRAEAIIPVVVDGAVVGTIDVESERRGAFDERDRAFLEACRDAAAPLWSRSSRQEQR
jgi:L-methionine (R)-S-oxide reductase